VKLVDEEDLQEFVRRLPEPTIDPPTVHLVMLATRSRKAKQILGIKIKDLVIERRIIRPTHGNVDWRDRYLKAVYNLALLQRHGKYYYRGVEIPVEARAIYATLIPRNVLNATADLIKEAVTYMLQGDDSARYQLCKLDVRYFGCLHRRRAKSRHLVTIDIDTDDLYLYESLLHETILREIPIFMVTATSRGFHIILDITEDRHAREFYHGSEGMCQYIKTNFENVEIKPDPVEPVPGSLYVKEDGTLHYVKILR